MKTFRILFLILLACSCVSLLAQTAQNTPASQPMARTDVYHVLFAKAVPGQAAQLGDVLKTPDPKAPMPGHLLVLMHQEGDEWDYAVIEHLGTKYTVDAGGNPAPPNVRDLFEWHTDTFVNGPPWADFAKAMGITPGAAKTTDSVYVLSVYRSVPGRRDQLEKFLSAPPAGSTPTSAGDVLLQHLEGGPWNFLSVSRYNSWQDFATNDSNSVAQTRKGSGGWFQLRENAAFHRDTLAVRMAP